MLQILPHFKFWKQFSSCFLSEVKPVISKIDWIAFVDGGCHVDWYLLQEFCGHHKPCYAHSTKLDSSNVPSLVLLDQALAKELVHFFETTQAPEDWVTCYKAKIENFEGGARHTGISRYREWMQDSSLGSHTIPI
jgi:hypothetical protein